MIDRDQVLRVNFGPCRTLVSEQIEHLFQSKSNTDFGAKPNTFGVIPK
jgi:hypothetical protein